MFDKFGIITPIKKNNFNAEEEIYKYFNSLVNNTNYNYTLLQSQIYNYDKSLKECFVNILKENSDYFTKMIENDMTKCNIIIEFINSLPKQMKIEFEECLTDNINNIDNYCVITMKYIQLENVIMHDDFKKYFSFTNFEENYCKLWLMKLSTYKKSRDIELLYNDIFVSVNNYYESKFHPLCKNIVLTIIEKIINFIKAIEDDKLKLKTSYDFYKKVHVWCVKSSRIDKKSMIKYIDMRNELSDIYYDTMKKYLTKCFTNIDDNKFEELNKVLYYCSKIQNETKILEDNKNYYFKYIFQNLSKKNIHKFIVNALGNLSNILEEILILLEKKLKNGLLNLKYDKFAILINDYKNITNNIQAFPNKYDPIFINIDKTSNFEIALQPHIYDFIKHLTNLITVYDIKNKDRDFRKLLTLSSDTLVHKFDMDDIYMNDFNHMNKLINQITKDPIFISKEQSVLIVEINKDGKVENVKLNMNQYMILLSLENDIENNIDVLKKGYGRKNIDYLIKEGYIEVNNNIVKKLIDS